MAMGENLGGGSATFFGRGLVPIYLHTKWHLDPCSHLAATDMAENWGLWPFGAGDLGPHLTQCGQGRGLYVHANLRCFILIRPTVWPQYPTLQKGQTDNGLLA